MDVNAPKMEIHQVDEHGNRVSAAEWAHMELTAEDRGVGNYAPGSKKARKQVIMQRRSHLREVGVAGLDLVKKTADGTGMMTCYNFVSDVALGIGKCACRRIPCSCPGYIAQRRKTDTKDRYGSTSDCVLDPIMKDGAKYYNSWKILTLTLSDKVKRNDTALSRLRMRQHKSAIAMSMKSYSATMAAGIVDGAFGAYTVDNVNYHYYIVKWTEEPFMVVEDEELKFGEGEDYVLVFKGD